MNFVHRFMLASLLLLCPLGSLVLAQADNPQIIMKTTMGDMKIELYPKEAPVTSKNFIEYVESGYFDGTIFHRVVNTPEPFVIQGGGFTKDMKKKKTLDPIKNEADNGLENLKYTLSMARTGDPNSATSQFFINLKDNPNLDREFRFGDGFGYAVFGKVIEGQEVVEKIRVVRTGRVGPYDDVPMKPVIITSAKVVDTEKK